MRIAFLCKAGDTTGNNAAPTNAARQLSRAAGKRRGRIALCCMLLALAPPALHAQADRRSAAATTPRSFVQRFFDWYVSWLNGDHPGPASARVVNDSTMLLTPGLVRALRADMEAKEQAKGEIAGLDFDPFVNSQDPCEHCQVGTVRQHGARYLVGVHGVCSGTRHTRPDVVVQLVRRGHTWAFENFHYPNLNTNLRSLLAKLHGEGPSSR